MAAFDPLLLRDEGISREFVFLKRRAQDIAQSILKAYGKPPRVIEFRYLNEGEFNAYARLNSGRYHIELNAAVPLFNLTLFYGLMSDDRFLPNLDKAGTAISNFTVPFVIDPADFDYTDKWRVSCNAIRAFAAGTLADTCNTFVVLHEFGHVICGHCEGKFHFDGDDALAELVTIKKSPVANLERNLAWEGDADMVAASLLAQFVEDLVGDIEVNNRTKEVFADPSGFHLENTTAIIVASLFVLFCYIEGTRRKFDKQGTHPQPQVRALLVKNVLHQQLEKRGEFNSEIFHHYLDVQLDSAMIALESLGIFDPKRYSRGFSKTMDHEFARLSTLQKKHRSDCAKWSWIEWS